jgi:LPS export ABC transporter protein LptC
MIKQSHFSYGLIFTTLFSIWLVWHFVINFSLNAPSNPNLPDSFAKNVTITVMDNVGKPQYQFFSPLVFHYAINDRTDFSEPAVVFFQPNQPAWRGIAEHGEAFQGDSKVTLWGNVFFTQSKGLTNPETHIQTQLLILYPETRIATTPEHISAVQPYSSISGVGMKLDMNAHTLDLLSAVQGMYLPEPPQKGEPVHVTSNAAHLDKQTEVATFLGNARLQQGPNSYAAPKIQYYIKKHMVVSPESTRGRTTIVIQPNSLKKGNPNG